MRTKNVILGLVAFVFAIGSAFTSIEFPAQTAYVWVKRQNQNFQCLNSQRQCTSQATDSEICQIEVTIDIPSSSKIVSAHLNSNCNATLLKNVDPDPLQFDPSFTDVVDAVTTP